MKLEQSFDVAAPLDQVWNALIDVERVAPCLPGASVTGRNDDGSFAGTLTIKIGPTTAAYAGRLEMERIDEGAHISTIKAQGTDRRGQGGAKATITSTLAETPDGTRVDVNTDYSITGRLARFGRGGMIEDISKRLLRDFAACLQQSLTAQPATATEPAPATEPATAAEPGVAGAGVEAALTEPSPAAEAATASAGAAAAQADTAAAPPSDATVEPTTTPPSTPPIPAAPPPPLAAPPPTQSNAIEGLPLLTSIFWERLRRNPVSAAAVLGFLLALVTLRRRRS
ncbi:MAG: SRPBCC family protein [Solirubrobacterales bacterium]|nr:SRPBCC family protein [Solirubrobacterales bacterium]